MYKLCKTEQSARRQRQIEDALLAAMQTKRYEDISVSDLCGEAGIPRKAFYRYFSGKDGALFALLDHRLMEYENRAGEWGNLWKYGFSVDLNWFFEFWQMQKPLLDALEHSGLSGILVERAIRIFQEATIFQYREHSREYVDAATAFATCGLMSLVLQWHHNGYNKSPREMAELSRKILTRPMVPGLEL